MEDSGREDSSAEEQAQLALPCLLFSSAVSVPVVEFLEGRGSVLFTLVAKLPVTFSTQMWEF